MMAVKEMCIPWKRRNVPAGPQPTADLTLNFSGKQLSICPRICAKSLKRKLLRAEKMVLCIRSIFYYLLMKYSYVSEWSVFSSKSFSSITHPQGS